MTGYEYAQIAQAQNHLWDALVVSHPMGRARACSAADLWWAHHRCQLVRLGAWREGRLAGGCLLAFKTIRYSPIRYMRILALLPDVQSPAESAAGLLHEATELARSRRAVEAELRAWVLPGPQESLADGIRQALSQESYAARAAIGGTYLVRIDVDDRQLLASFDGKCRNQVRSGGRGGVAVQRLEGPEHVALFCQAHSRMCDHKNLGHLEAVQADSLMPLVEAGHFQLFGALYQGRVCNLALVDALGVPQLSLAARVETKGPQPLPPTGQVLQYEIMRYFRDRGSRLYDLGGSPGPVPQADHPNYTVWRFKHAFKGPYVEVLGTFGRSIGGLGRLMALFQRQAA